MRHASLNRIYRLIWSPVQQAWVIASEHAKGRSKTNNRQLQKLLAITVLATGSSAWAAPSGGQVTAGSGSISSSGNTTTVTQSSQNLSLNWQSFNTSKQEVVNFIQPSASAIAVNRISDPNPTQFFGQLNANGQVFLINPNGVLFGAGSQINVGGLVASTLDISDAGLNNLNRQFSGSATGSIINQGNIHASDGGYIAFVGNTVSNQGSLSAPMGVVALAAGSDATLTFADNHLVKMQVNRNTLQNLAENGGLIQADGGAVLLSAGAKDAVLASVVNNTGIIEARSVQNLNGSIILDGGNLGSTSQSGRLDVTGKQAGETGGTVKVLGGQVSLGAGSTIDASGDAGGGTVLVGGNFHGAGSEQNAQSTTIAAGTTINADAINSGDGGKVAVWSDGRTQFNGSITARGGANAGNGGQVETSGQTLLIDSTAGVNTAAPKGSAGNWLLDPDDITIGNRSAWGSGYGINVDTSVLTAALNNGNVTIKTTASSGNCTGVSCSASGGGNGDIIILDTIGSGYNYAGTIPTTSYNWVTGSTLTLSAYRNIRFKLTSNVAWNSGGDVGGGVSIDAGGHLVLQADNSSKGTGTVTFDDSTGMTAVYFSSGSGSTTIFYNPITLNSPTDYSPYVFTQSTSQLVAYMAVNLSATIADKVYDGTTNASLSNVSATLPTGITLNTSAQAASFSDKNVGSNKTVSLSGIGFNGGGTMSAPDGQSYRTISYGGNDYYLNGLSTQTANITPKSVNVTGLAANNKTYDGSTSATLAGSASLAASDVINGDVLTLSGTGVGTFANANAGSNKTVTVTGYSLAGTDAGNYSFVAPAGLTATINKADLTLSGSKTYDATTSVTGSLLTASGVNGQTFSVTGTGDTSNLSSKNVQTNATLNSVTGLALGTSSNGGLSSNYNALSTTGSAITVTAKTLTLSGITASDKVYDGTSTATLNTSSVGYAGLINGDTVSLNGSASASFADKNAGSNKAVSVSGYTLSGSDAGNYTVVQPTGLTANINK
ncbi:YDG domain-containing protein, partial [Aquitalea aquatica]